MFNLKILENWLKIQSNWYKLGITSLGYRVLPRKTHGKTHGGTSAGEQSVNGGLMRGDIDLMGGLTLIDYIIN